VIDELHWLDVPDRVFFKLAVLVHRCLNGRAPPSGGSGVYIWGGSGVNIIAAGGARTYIAIVNHP